MAMEFNEYIPKGGWVRHNKMRGLKEKAKGAALGTLFLLGILAVYGIVGAMEVC